LSIKEACAGQARRITRAVIVQGTLPWKRAAPRPPLASPIRPFCIAGRGDGATDHIYIYIYNTGRAEGASDRELLIVAEAMAEGFVGTKRLEEEAGGAYGWRNVLLGSFRSAA
jgi:hypothetical protein